MPSRWSGSRPGRCGASISACANDAGVPTQWVTYSPRAPVVGLDPHRPALRRETRPRPRDDVADAGGAVRRQAEAVHLEAEQAEFHALDDAHRISPASVMPRRMPARPCYRWARRRRCPMSTTPLHDWLRPRLDLLFAEANAAGFEREAALAVLTDIDQRHLQRGGAAHRARTAAQRLAQRIRPDDAIPGQPGTREHPSPMGADVQQPARPAGLTLISAPRRRRATGPACARNACPR